MQYDEFLFLFPCRELVELPYIKECLALSQSHIVQKKKAKQEAACK